LGHSSMGSRLAAGGTPLRKMADHNRQKEKDP
jgi:hypothetical protein